MSDKKIKKRLTVVASYPLSPHMQRIEFTTEDMHYFNQDAAGQYVKLMFAPNGSVDLSLLKTDQQAVLRTFTLSVIDPINKRLAIDFVKHSGVGGGSSAHPLALQAQGGYGQHFVEHAKVGDVVMVRGPGQIQTINLQSDWLLLVADMTAIPALSQLLAQLAEDTQGYLVVELCSLADLPAFNLPKKLKLTVRVRDQGPSLAATVAQLDWLAGQPSLWCACEFSDMKAIRHYVQGKCQLERSACYVSSYWKYGVTEEGHKLAKLAHGKEAN